jgi:hypothetical protein
MSAFTTAQLTAEINTDPKALGYAAFVASGNDTGVAALLNATYAGVGTVWLTRVPTSALVGSIVWADVSGMTQAQVELLQLLLLTGTVDASNPNIRGMFTGLFAGKTTLTNMTAAAQKVAPSRAEELWGAGTTVTVLDVAHALGRG